SSSSQRISVSIVLGMVLVMVLLLAKQIITLYHAVQKTLTKHQHALVVSKCCHIAFALSSKLSLCGLSS
ncbi:hypothetical protein REH81_36635, partial [Vibrio rotiferianus]